MRTSSLLTAAFALAGSATVVSADFLNYTYAPCPHEGVDWPYNSMRCDVPGKCDAAVWMCAQGGWTKTAGDCEYWSPVLSETYDCAK